MMNLNTFWFAIMGLLFAGYFFLEGFDYGVGMLLPFLGQTDRERRAIIKSIGPFWDGNEVWLVVLGGTMFAVFPEWYATMFSAFYLPLLFILVCLILRGAGIELRNKEESPRWRRRWDIAICIGSFGPAFLWGVAVGNLMQGIAIDQNKNYIGTFFAFLRPYPLLCGIAFVFIFLLHGAVFLNMKLTDHLRSRAHEAARRLWLPTVVLIAAFVIFGYLATDIFQSLGVDPGLVPLFAAGCLLAVGWFIKIGHEGWAFVMTGMAIIFSSFSVSLGLYPRVMISSLNPVWDLTIYNAASSTYTLIVLSWITLILLPFVIGYQIWNFYIFRRRVSLPAASES